MTTLLAFLVFIHRPDFGMYADHTEAMDLFVIMTLCTLFFLLGCFATIAWQIWRRTTRPTPHERLLMELAESNEEEIIQAAEDKSSGAESKITSWEKPPDWWKQ